MTLDGCLEGDIGFLSLRIPRRLLFTFLIVSVVKVAGGFLLYHALEVPSTGTYWMDAKRVPPLEQNRALLEGLNQSSRWPYLFLGWDSAWYLSIMTRGYFSSQSYAFLPGFPILGLTLNLFLANPIASAVVVSAIFGVLWVPVYQALAEIYMGKRAAMASTLLFALSPVVFLFSTVAYSEGLFLFLTLCAWYLSERGKVLHGSFLASLATIVRWPGMLIMIPMFLKYVRGRGPSRFRLTIYTLMPIASQFLWRAYCWVAARDWFASAHTTEWSGMYTLLVYIFDLLPRQGAQALLFPSTYLSQLWFAPILTWVSLIAAPPLIYRLWKVDRPLSVYSLTYFLGVVYFGAALSLSRLISFLFPLWMLDTSKLLEEGWSTILLAVIIVLFVVTGLTLWAGFLNGVFVG